MHTIIGIHSLCSSRICRKVNIMHSFLFFLILSLSRDLPAYAESSHESIGTNAWKYLQKTNFDENLPSRKTADPDYIQNLPNEFDARKHFINCATVISDVKDQGNCASSWAVAVASTFTDRFCIATNGSFTDNLSAQNLMSCGDDEQSGCSGGSAFRAWEYTMKKGIVTGGNFGSKKGCQPYRRRQCNHYGVSGMKNCSDLGPMQKTICKDECLNKDYKIDYKDDLHKTSDVYMTSWTNVRQIQQEIITYGPVTAFLYVYENFVAYKGDVYKSTTGDLVGYQYVKLIGWGVDKDGDGYWLAMNSWNSGWGDGGLFKILRGYNFCSIELLAMAGTVL